MRGCTDPARNPRGEQLDTLYGESEVLAARESGSRPTAGIVTVRTTGRNQEGTVVCVFERSILVPKRGHGVEDQANY